MPNSRAVLEEDVLRVIDLAAVVHTPSSDTGIELRDLKTLVRALPTAPTDREGVIEECKAKLMSEYNRGYAMRVDDYIQALEELKGKSNAR